MLSIFCILLSSIVLSTVTTTAGELFTSANELDTKWTLVESEISNLVDTMIEQEQVRLVNLQNVRNIFSNSYNNSRSTNLSLPEEVGLKTSIHPVEAFVKINRIVKVLNELELLAEKEEEQAKLRLEEFSLLDEQALIPSPDDLIGAGEALLRLQTFYELSTDDMIKGKLRFHDNNNNETSLGQQQQQQTSTIMNYEDCFELGKIAYEGNQFNISIQWLQKAFELLDKDQSSTSTSGEGINHQLMNDILEYMAFAAYKDGQLEYSAKLTRLWLERDPHNERAIGNLEYYEEELEVGENSASTLVDTEIDSSSGREREQQQSYREIYQTGQRFNPNGYEISDDEIVKSLCKGSGHEISKGYHLKCSKQMSNNFYHYQELNIEQLNIDPNIIRIYDIISEQEAAYIREQASTKLLRSTVQSKSGLVTSNFRIAKTAWLSKDLDPIVNKIDQRLSEILELDLSSSEDLQVVNYGLGGYYGPHLDSARESKVDATADSKKSENSSSMEADEISVPITSLSKNDRLATILIYLNHVEAGGSTVFPRLNLTIEPIERSAIVWFNIKKDGFTDYKTLHSGCPVLLGSKWIATKWPRERENCFLRPCGLKPD